MTNPQTEIPTIETGHHAVASSPRETWYRYVDNRLDSFDGYGDFTGEHRPGIDCWHYYVAKHTPKGVWLSMQPGRSWSDKHFVLNASKKKLAYPTKEEAWESFKIRKERQLGILRSQADHVAAVLRLIERDGQPK